MFRAVLFSSSRGQIALLRHLVSSLSVNDRTVLRLTADLQSSTLSVNKHN